MLSKRISVKISFRVDAYTHQPWVGVSYTERSEPVSSSFEIDLGIDSVVIGRRGA